MLILFFATTLLANKRCEVMLARVLCKPDIDDTFPHRNTFAQNDAKL